MAVTYQTEGVKMPLMEKDSVKSLISSAPMKRFWR